MSHEIINIILYKTQAFKTQIKLIKECHRKIIYDNFTSRWRFHILFKDFKKN